MASASRGPAMANESEEAVFWDESIEDRSASLLSASKQTPTIRCGAGIMTEECWDGGFGIKKTGCFGTETVQFFIGAGGLLNV